MLRSGSLPPPSRIPPSSVRRKRWECPADFRRSRREAERRGAGLAYSTPPFTNAAFPAGDASTFNTAFAASAFAAPVITAASYAV
jgi:hypothetical protein